MNQTKQFVKKSFNPNLSVREELAGVCVWDSTHFVTKTPLRLKSHAIDSPQQEMILALWIGSEDPKLKGHHPTPFWEAKKRPLHPHTEQ